jgi:GntR family transcriptional regulator
MFDDIDPRSTIPLYDQIAGRIRLAVAAGEIGAGEALPSVRGLASRLRVNPATVVQAYRSLETEGFVEMRQGSGTYVRGVTAERRQQEQEEQGRRLARELLAEAARLGVPGELVSRALQRELGGGGRTGRVTPSASGRRSRTGGGGSVACRTSTATTDPAGNGTRPVTI